MKQGKNIFIEGRKIAEDISSVMKDDAPVSEHLDEWLLENDCSADVIEKLTDENRLSDICREFKNDKHNVIERLRRELDTRRSRRKMILQISTGVAAALTIVSLLIISNDDKDTTSQSVIAVVAVDEQANRKPMLITAGGEQLDLSKDMTITGGFAEAKDDTLWYNTIANNNPLKESEYNKLILPEKCTYVVTLSDGTKVTLNSNSTLEYPTAFLGDKREVMLTGEAYFEVEKDTGKPFIVRTGKTSVRVYGTKFNVNSYNPVCVMTSLVSGIVGVTLEGRSEVILNPGLMLILNENSAESRFSKFNIYRYEAWQKGFFRCDNEEVNVILEDISNWYGVTFEYELTQSRHITLSASISREESIEEVLQLLNITSGVKFKKKGEKVYIVR